jgi:uncharacterized protein (TIGR03437 family)
MRIPPAVACLFVCSAIPSLAQEVGQGSPNDYVRGLFLNAYHRGTFAQIAVVPPLGAVKKFGTTGYVQEFTDSTKAGSKMALVKADLSVVNSDTGSGNVYQVFSDLYTYYSTVTVATAGYPVMDTQQCPGASCNYQLFDKRYALFVYSAGSNDVTNITVREPFYSHWDISNLGSALTAEVATTSASGAAATVQTFAQGALFNMTAGASTGRFITVRQPIFSLYSANKSLGLPVSDELSLPNGNKQQRFEGGAIEYGPTTGPVLKMPVSRVVLQATSTPVRLKLGETAALQTAVFTADGSVAGDRAVAFTTSNSRVVAVQPSGQGVTLRAVGGGQAIVTAISEGKSSAPVPVIVSAPCCAIGEGAPSSAAQQIFVDAVQRARVLLQVPTADRAHRVGNGYVQEFQGAEPNTARRYLVAVSDRSAQGYVVSGAVLDRYESFGGPAQSLGYPTSDASPGGRQNFEGGAIAGAPGRVVSGALLAKWANLGYETGPVGSPTGDASPVLTFAGTTGIAQAFEKGLLLAATVGPESGKAHFVSGLVLSKYTSLGSATGSLGLPVTDEFVSVGRRRQDFEGGSIDYAAGDADAKLTLRDRKPTVSATPLAVAAGTRVRLTVSGFADGSTLRISVAGQPDFLVKTSNGSYTWEVAIGPTAPTASVLVKAVDVANAAATAQVTYTVKSVAEIKAQLSKLAGDSQTGSPGAVLPQALKILLRDDSGNPLPGAAVKFSASPGASVDPQSTTTDQNGQAQTVLRLPPSEAAVLVTAEAYRQVATFSGLATATSLNFPKFIQAGSETIGQGTDTIASKGALLTAVASIIRYHQDRGELGTPRGLADPSALNQFLKTFCTYDSTGGQVCDGYITAASGSEQILNLWRAGEFVLNNLAVSVETPDIVTARDFAGQGSPVLIALSLKAGTVPAGAHYVVATGVASDGTVLIQDPNPVFGRTNLNAYATGFAVNGSTYTGTVSGVVRLLPRRPSETGFVVSTTNRNISIVSQAGECGATFSVPDVTATGSIPTQTPGVFNQKFCDGSQSVYELDLVIADGFQAAVTDLADLGGRTELSGGGAASFRLSRPGAQLVVSPQEVSIGSRSIVNAATFTLDMAPGGIVSAFGNGLARDGSPTVVEVNGLTARLLSASPFQLNFQLPSTLPAGTNIVRITSPYGSVEQQIDVQVVAPAVFRLPSLGPDRGAVVNQDGKINRSGAAAKRGSTIVIYGTGLGSVIASGQLSVVVTPVTVILNGTELPVAFAGLTPGFIGLYQINLAIPLSTPPDLAVSLSVRQGKVESSPVLVAIE